MDYMCYLNSYKTLEYMQSFSREQSSLLLAMRTRTVRGIRSDFGDMYASYQCQLCVKRPHKDTIEALTKCPSLSHTKTNGTEFADMFSTSVTQQSRVTQQFKIILNKREAQLTRLEHHQDI